MKRTLRVVAAALALLGMSFGGSPKAEATTEAAALVVTGSIQMAYGYMGPGPVGCPTGINFVPPSVVDPCTPTQGTLWQLAVAGAVTPGAVGGGVCFFSGEAEEQLAYGSGEVSGDCYLGPDGLTDCTIRYTRIGMQIVGIVSGCVGGTIVLQAVPSDTAFRSMAVIGTLSGA